MKNNDLDKLFDIRNFDIKKSNIHNNRFWKKETLEAVKKKLNNDKHKDKKNGK
tara:strand:+ start:232 stop:390 length:159 start_codon:yes stop_codon:yes gene_type:complete